jgi:2-aminobenzoate-CoA ligase
MHTENKYSAHVDKFVWDNLPPVDQWPTFINLEKLGYGERLNCATEILDNAIEAGHGEKVAIYSPSVSWTYNKLQSQANRIACVLTEDFEIVPGERVLIHSKNNAMLAACWFATQKAGAIAVTTMPLLRAPELQYISEKSRTRLAICDWNLSDEIEQAKELSNCLQDVVYFGGEGKLEELMEAKNQQFRNVDTAATDVSLIAFTSGTTGSPKATTHFHRDVMAICDTFSKKVFKPVPDDVFMGTPPLAFTFGLGSLLLFPLHARASAVLLEDVSPDHLKDALARFRPSVMATAPTAYRALMNTAEPEDLACLNKCLSAGEPLTKAISDQWHENTGNRIVDGLGTTEMLHVFVSAEGADIRPGSTGLVVPGYEAKIIDEEGQELPTGEMGYLAVRGPTGCRYLADERQLQYVRNGWNLTGDFYQQDDDGYFWFRSRSDDMIISAGYNISPLDVENVLMTHRAVAECAVVGKPDEARGHIVKAFIVPNEKLHEQMESPEEKENLIETLKQHVKDTVAPYKYPRDIEFVSELPRTNTGKIQRFKLRE